jgi:hypothetical protein
MLDKGYAVVSVDYSLIHQKDFPFQIYEIKAALRFLRAHADEYHKILVAKACEILEQPSEVQVSLASAVQNSNYQAVASGGGNLEDRLAGLGTVVASESKPADEENFEATAGDDDVLHQAVRSLGRR